MTKHCHLQVVYRMGKRGERGGDASDGISQTSQTSRRGELTPRVLIKEAKRPWPQMATALAAADV